MPIAVIERATSLAATEQIESYATLINRKLVIPSTASDYLAVERHFLFQLLAPMLEKAPVDEKWYVSAHPDVAKAIEDGVVRGARHHYVMHGYFEHRRPYKIDVDEKWYLSAYPDVKDAIQRREFTSGQEHFELSGFREGRLPFPGFSLFGKA